MPWYWMDQAEWRCDNLLQPPCTLPAWSGQQHGWHSTWRYLAMPLIANRSMSLSILKTYPLSPLLLTDGLGIQWHCLAIVSIFIFNVRLILDFLSVSLKCISIQRIQNYSQKAWRSTRQLESSAVHRRVWLTIVRDQCPWQSCSLYLYAGSLAALACKNSGGKRGPFSSPRSHPLEIARNCGVQLEPCLHWLIGSLLLKWSQYLAFSDIHSSAAFAVVEEGLWQAEHWIFVAAGSTDTSDFHHI